MFNKKFKQLASRVTSLGVAVREMELRINRLNAGMAVVDEQYSAMSRIKADMAKMDALTSMMSELARRVDLAGIAKLPDECKCEACGCNNIKVNVPKAVSKLPVGKSSPYDMIGLDGYCVKCKEKRPIIDMRIRTSDSGRRMALGKCPVCNTKMNRILGKEI